MTDTNSEMPPDGTDVLTIEKFVSGGDGLARREDGCVVFVPRSAVGDRVEVEYTQQQRQWRRARARRLIEPGPQRVDAPCEYYDRCGGCQLQHLEYEAQLVAKSSIIVDCLQRLGGQTIEAVGVEPSPKQLGYRNRVSLLARRGPDRVVAGYHVLEHPDEIVDIASCPLAEAPINAVWKSLRERLAAVMDGVAGDLRLTLRTNTKGQVGLAIEGGRPDADMTAALGAIEGLHSVWWLNARGHVVHRAGEPTLAERCDAWDIPLAGVAFLQVNRGAAALLDSYVIEQCGNVRGLRIIDAYCGFGVRSMQLAKAGAIVTGIDSDRGSIGEAIRMAGEDSIGVGFVASTVEQALPRQLPAELAILNPPRRGVDRGVVNALLEQPPTRIIYVSCDPATLARDIRTLEGYELEACRAFDLFPQTAHVETVATLTRAL